MGTWKNPLLPKILRVRLAISLYCKEFTLKEYKADLPKNLQLWDTLPRI